MRNGHLVIFFRHFGGLFGTPFLYSAAQREQIGGAKPGRRNRQEQQKVTRSVPGTLALYHSKPARFAVKVRKKFKRMSLILNYVTTSINTDTALRF